jgi:hypothetical protein
MLVIVSHEPRLYGSPAPVETKPEAGLHPVAREAVDSRRSPVFLADALQVAWR